MVEKANAKKTQFLENVFFLFLVIRKHLQDIPPKKLLPKQQGHFKHPSCFLKVDSFCQKYSLNDISLSAHYID